MSGRLADMEAAWGTGDQVQCIHPLSACIAGREQVLASWKSVFGGGRLRIALEDVRICAGESEAFVTCVEVVDASEEEGRVAATNVFEKQQGAWKMVLHHASPLPRPLKFS
jgi:translation initiation factor 2A